jgi:glyoxylase-like metal-dependent hydrolase (beta-lactamase superfamily II)
MNEILPGVHHWKAFHHGIGAEVSSHYVRSGNATTLIDPMEPEEGVEWFRTSGPPGRILLSNRHHYRHSDRFVEAFGSEVRCHRAGMHEFEDGPAVTPFVFGDEPAPGVTALKVGAICEEDTALHISAGEGALLFADGLINYGSLSFVPDSLIGDDPAAVKRGLIDSLTALLDADFDHLLFAHGDPVIGGGKAALQEFVARGA